MESHLKNQAIVNGGSELLTISRRLQIGPFKPILLIKIKYVFTEVASEHMQHLLQWSGNQICIAVQLVMLESMT